VTVARANEQAAATEANARIEAAEIAGRAYAADPGLYVMLRSFDTLDSVVGQNTRLILRTDAVPFRVLVDGPTGARAGQAPQGAAFVGQAAQTQAPQDHPLQGHPPQDQAQQAPAAQVPSAQGPSAQGQTARGQLSQGEASQGTPR
jgi:hypothetical protein